MTYLYLAAAILLEVCGTLSMKWSEGYTKLTPSVISVSCYILSIFALSMTVRRMDISIAYAIWCGVGIALITVGGLVLFKETVTPTKILWIAMIAIGCVGLNLCRGH